MGITRRYTQPRFRHRKFPRDFQNERYARARGSYRTGPDHAPTPARYHIALCLGLSSPNQSVEQAIERRCQRANCAGKTNDVCHTAAETAETATGRRVAGWTKRIMDSSRVITPASVDYVSNRLGGSTDVPATTFLRQADYSTFAARRVRAFLPAAERVPDGFACCSSLAMLAKAVRCTGARPSNSATRRSRPPSAFT